MYYRSPSGTQFTPKNRPLQQNTASVKCQQFENGTMVNPASLNNVALESVLEQTRTRQKHVKRKSNSNRSSLLASCRNILKEFLSQNGMP